MSHKISIIAVAALAIVSLCATVGCETAYGPNVGLMGYPIPVTPYLQDCLEDRAHEHERYGRVPILGPITSGAHMALDPPSDDEIMCALERANPVEGGTPFLHTTQRNNVRIVVEPIADYVDPPRVYPMIGPAQQHHAHYKCIVYYSEKIRVGWPLPYTIDDEDSQEVIYIDHNHLHMCANVDTGPGSNF